MRTAHKLQLDGMRFGRLIVLQRLGAVGGTHHVLWSCRCDCGNVVEVKAQRLRTAWTQSCGCLQRESAKALVTLHGNSLTPEYKVWDAMIQRWTNPNTKQWDDYGGRGITVCDRWRDYRNFIADMGHRPSSEFSIDRIDNDGNYEPENCRWATRSQQMKNARPRGQGSKARSQV